MTVTITSFGYSHQEEVPVADLTIDARRTLRNPHHDPAMRYKTGLDFSVRAHVLDTPGARELILHTAAAALGLLAATSLDVAIATGCAGGRHRAVALAEEIAARLRTAGVVVKVEHRDIGKPVLPSSSHSTEGAAR